MAFTRFHDDTCRIEKQLHESTGSCRYILNTPGTGVTPHFMEDPFIRMDKWGANLRSDFTDISSDLRGLTRSLKRDSESYKEKRVASHQKQYPSKAPITDQSRATHPAWLSRDLEYIRWEYPNYDPQKGAVIPCNFYMSSRHEQKRLIK
jgi:hypothetical protein